MNRNLFLLLAAVFFCTLLTAQRSIVVLGSSTAAGTGSSSDDSSWAGRLRGFYNKNVSDGRDTSLTNLAFPGYVTYKIMPSEYVTPANRTTWLVDQVRNVTRARDLRPDVVIISMVSNDVDITPDYNMKETMDNFRTMFQYLNAARIRTYITTTQPRNNFTVAQRQMLRQLRDSVLNNFGPFAINFWDDLVTSDGQNLLRDDLRADLIHPNNTGHRFLFERVVARNIFSIANTPLPVKLSFFKAQVQNNRVTVSWRAEGQETGTSYEVERSSNGRDYISVYTQAGTSGTSGDYIWHDAAPLKGTSHYRLKIKETSKISYSSIARVAFGSNKAIAALFVSGGTLHVDLGQAASGKAEIQVLNPGGAIVGKKTFVLTDSRIQVPIANLPAGQYFLRLVLASGTSEVQAFNKSN